jgi:uncharacterized iron-regulated protein
MRRVLLVGFCVAWLGACGLAPARDEVPSLGLADHPLVDKIWDVRGQRFIDRAQLARRLLQSDYVLLGETHDNISHHRHEAWVLDTLAAGGRSAAVAFEMIDATQGELLADKRFTSTDALIQLLDHVRTTWDYDRQYRPVFDSALRAGFRIVPASLDRQAISGIIRNGAQQIPPPLKARMDAHPLDKAQLDSLRGEVEVSHCGMLNPKMVSAMMLTQRVKDAGMAQRLVAQTGVASRVLVAGSGHVRTDRGVPLYLPPQAGAGTVLAVAWLEVAADVDTVQAYTRYWGDERLPFDYVWFTPRVERADPCESLRRHMHNKEVGS